ncbi:cobalt-precorrin-2 C(20)-methyltransferase [Halococcus hamelinensis 100A6]|uniref:Cobalt-precorrin-2 C(20)-methyltransferase n=1 Tax=Halococcus hamelinensis 100A6 TaxID=1132509 RepID=M0M9T8_9EURY|nr:cobalt-precorrin-2 C(20)-methyltransferase [Halococcus hamelinensis 100A6]
MTLYGSGLGPGAADLLTVRGKRVLESVAVVYSPGRLSRRVAAEYVPDSTLSDLEFPMTTDPEKLRTAWSAAADEVAPRARENDAAFLTLGDPCIYSTFGHLRRTLGSAISYSVSLRDDFGILDVRARPMLDKTMRSASATRSPTPRSATV